MGVQFGSLPESRRQSELPLPNRNPTNAKQTYLAMEATLATARAKQEQVQSQLDALIGGENASVVSLRAQLKEAEYNLSQTEVKALSDGCHPGAAQTRQLRQQHAFPTLPVLAPKALCNTVSRPPCCVQAVAQWQPTALLPLCVGVKQTIPDCVQSLSETQNLSTKAISFSMQQRGGLMAG